MSTQPEPQTKAGRELLDRQSDPDWMDLDYAPKLAAILAIEAQATAAARAEQEHEDWNAGYRAGYGAARAEVARQVREAIEPIVAAYHGIEHHSTSWLDCPLESCSSVRTALASTPEPIEPKPPTRPDPTKSEEVGLRLPWQKLEDAAPRQPRTSLPEDYGPEAHALDTERSVIPHSLVEQVIDATVGLTPAAPRQPEPDAIRALDAVLGMMENADKGDTWPDMIDTAKHVIEAEGLSVLESRISAAAPDTTTGTTDE